MPLNPLRITLVQTDIHWLDAERNRQELTKKIQTVAQQTDIVVLPEMFTTGFMMTPESHAEAFDGVTLLWLKAMARASHAAICGSVAMYTESHFVNRFLFVTPTGEVEYYDKRHLFRMGDEINHYVGGQERKVFTYQGWRILPQVCYDLRFPVFMRNRDDYDLVLLVANWPIARRQAWRTLLQARAIENQAYVVGVNRIGTDGMNLNYSGDSMAVNVHGEILADHPAGEAFIQTVQMDMADLNAFREKFPAWMDADSFDLSS